MLAVCLLYFVYSSVVDSEVVLLALEKQGLDPNFNLPVRYVTLFSKNPNTDIRYNSSVGAVSFKLVPADTSLKQRPRYRSQVLDLRDGSYIIRWRLYASAQFAFSLLVELDHQVVFTHNFTNGLAAEECYCPSKDPQPWLHAIGCPSADTFNQIQLDFHTFPSIDIQRLAREVPDRFNRSHSMIHYSIVNNQVYRRQYGKHGDFKRFSDDIILSLLRKVRLADTEFVMNLGDWPAEKRACHDYPVAILTWGGSFDTRDISLPTWDITKKTCSGLQQESMDVQTVAGSDLPEWDLKVEKGFFRGRDSRKERLDLVRRSHKHPSVLDAGITNYFFFRKGGEEAELGKAERVSMSDFHRYKYQINMDGTVAAYRLPFLLAGNSVVFKHESNFYEHFYDRLEPYIHFVPFHRNLSDLIDKVEWARSNDVFVRQISKQAQKLALEYLSPNMIYCYYFRVLQTYVSRQWGEPRVHENMEKVEQPKHECRCDRWTGQQQTHSKEEL